MSGLRQKVASKAKQILEAQQQPVPKITDPGPGAAPAPKPSATPAPQAPAPLPAPAPKDKQVDDDIEHDKREESKLEKIEEKLNKLTDSLESLTTVMKSQQRFLERKLTTSEEEEDEFKDFKEDESDEMFEDSFTKEELGVDTDNLIVSKEEGMPKKSLREARKERLQKSAMGEYKEEKTLSEEFDLEKAKKKTFSPKSPEVPKGKVKPSEIPSMLKLAEVALELNDGKDKWTVMHTSDEGDVPVYEVSPTDETAEKFATKGFAKELIHAMKDLGVEAALEKYGAKKVEAKLPEVKKEEKLPVESAEAKEEPPVVDKKEASDHKRRFVRAFRLALSAMQKNLTDNPLKGAFFEMLSNLNMPESQAKKIIEAAFAKAAAEHFEVALAKADEYLKMSDESFVEIEAAIGDVVTHIPEDAPESLLVDEEGQALRARASRASLPINTRSDSDPTDKLDALASVLPRPKLHGINRSTM